jgi:hypothetical protein
MDGQIIVQAIKEAINNPIEREYDQQKYWCHTRTSSSLHNISSFSEL